MAGSPVHYRRWWVAAVLTAGVAAVALVVDFQGVSASVQPIGARPTRPLVIPENVRVGLATDLERLTLPCCGSDLRAQAGETQVALVEPFTVEPAARGGRGVYRLQVAALKDEAQARRLALEMAEREGTPADVVFDAGTGLYRVRVGRYAGREEADEAAMRLAMGGSSGAFVVSEPSASVAEGLRVTQGESSWRVRGRWVAVWSRSEAGVRISSGRYRGRILLYLNDRGTLNLINELPLEDYLRGVVPREMGPEAYDSLEGLKAQAVAARSYAVHNLSEFTAEGYDICATPRCQVYGGVAAEHPLSDRAVAETVGQVLAYGGGPVDAMYSSTCGGHTEDVAIVFPARDEPYLRAVPCFEAGLTELSGDLPPGEPFPEALVRRLLPPREAAVTAAGTAGRIRQLASEAGFPQPRSFLQELDRRSLTRYLADWLDLAFDAELFVSGADVPYALGEAPAGWSSEELRLAAYLARLGVLDGPLAAPLSTRELERSLLALMTLLRTVEQVEGRFASLKDGRLAISVDSTIRDFEIGRPLATFRGREGELRAAPLAMVPGDHLKLFLEDGELVAITQRVERSGAAYDRSSKFSSWRRFRTDRELAALIAERHPGFEFRGLQVLERGRSGRVGRIRVLGDGSAVEIEGLAIRWALDLPDTLFTAKRLEPPQAEPGWLFAGRGWGHGVGLCQVGAYGMGLRGHSYMDILTHYYSGVSAASVEVVPRPVYEDWARRR